MASMIARVVSRGSAFGLTDVVDVARFKRLIAALARQLDEVYYQLVRVTDVWSIDRAVGNDLERRVADLQPVGLVRLGAVRSVVTVVFSRRVVSGTAVIPKGTIVRTNAGISYRTTLEAEITTTSAIQIAGDILGQDSGPVPCVAVVAGSASNQALGAITQISGNVVGVDSVVSVTPASSGSDEESDDQLRARAKDYIASLGRCGIRAIEFAAIGVTDGTKQVRFAKAIANPLRRGDVFLYIDDGAGTADTNAAVTNELVTQGLLGPPANSAVGGEEFLFLASPPVKIEGGYEVRVNGTPLINDSTIFLSPTDGLLRFDPALILADVVRADYVKFTGLIPAVQKVIDGIYADPNFPGWGAGGVRIRVLAPRIVVPQISGTIFTSRGTDHDSAVLAAQDAAIKLINGGGISQDVVIAAIIEKVMEVSGIVDVVLDQTENFNVLDDELARVTTSTVNFV